MTKQQLLAHIETRQATPNGTIARRETEDHNGHRGVTHVDVKPVAMAFIRATHHQGCTCSYCR